MMRKLFLLTFVLFCVGCGSPTSNKTNTPSVGALTPEEQLNQRIREWTDSTIKAQAYLKRNLGSILPEWTERLFGNQEKLLAESEINQVQYLYAELELWTSGAVWNKQLEGEGYALSDAVLQAEARDRVNRPKHQTAIFPQLRLLYAQGCAGTYWIDDIDVKVSGKRNQYIHFIGSRFSRNKRIKEFHEEISETCEVLRFEQVRYSWREGRGYEYFSMYDGKDSDPIPTILDAQYQWGVFPNSF